MAFKRKAKETDASAYDKALALLSRREHSTRELKTKLAQRGFEQGESDQALGTLKRENYQSDSRFADVLIRHRAEAGYGPRYIEAELRSHGLDPRQFRVMFDQHDWPAVARALIQKRFGKRLTDRTDKLKAAQFLARRGFPGNIVYAASGGVEVPDEPDS